MVIGMSVCSAVVSPLGAATHSACLAVTPVGQPRDLHKGSEGVKMEPPPSHRGQRAV
ncbi:hypothetical protein HaLaN_17957, partial [Haematococcus lacustris]